jgi:tripartite-type tricarboxylate transporter receptor subunit TctC
VDDRAGAGGIVGTELASKAAADGYSLLVGGASSVTVTPMMQKLSHGITRDFAPIFSADRSTCSSATCSPPYRT